MNFELKPLGLVGVASEKCDVLVVLVPQSFKAAKDDLSALVAQTLKLSDLEAKAGKLLHLYRPDQCGATRVADIGRVTQHQLQGLNFVLDELLHPIEFGLVLWFGFESPAHFCASGKLNLIRSPLDQ